MRIKGQRHPVVESPLLLAVWAVCAKDESKERSQQSYSLQQRTHTDTQNLLDLRQAWVTAHTPTETLKRRETREG